MKIEEPSERLKEALDLLSKAFSDAQKEVRLGLFEVCESEEN